MIRRISGPKRNEVKGKCIKLHNEVFNDLYILSNSFSSIKARMEWMEHLTHMVEGRGIYNVLEGYPDRNNPPGIPSFIWEENIKENRKEVGNVLSCSIKCG